MNTPRNAEAYFPNADDIVTGSRLIQRGDTLFVREINSRTVPLVSSVVKIVRVIEGLGTIEHLDVGDDFNSTVPSVLELAPGDVIKIDAGITHRFIPESEGPLLIEEQMSEGQVTKVNVP